ncbi:MAG TPA: hypothetical protein VJV75_10610 [Candidatus Polarisedimenticolia bacterium]|nr:hypothetical protein [Candidatus Polarisedimenticolia bacterium]
MTPFTARTVTLSGSLAVAATVEDAFPLFSPHGERRWVPGWDPEVIHPPESEWRQDQVFRTREEKGDAFWVISRLDRARHTVDYHRIEPGRYVAHVSVRCEATSPGTTLVTVAYSFVGLSESGNDEVAAMTQAEYDKKMGRWSNWIAAAIET